MGWISSGSDFYKGRTGLENKTLPAQNSSAKRDAADLCEDPDQSTNSDSETRKSETAARPLQGLFKSHEVQKSTSNVSKLPHFSTDEVLRRDGKECEQLWIVVDSIVYDCSEFFNEHPGGEEVIRSFGGRDCSWQFWRFHARTDMEEWGTPLRVGTCQGATNPYREPNRWVGLKRLGAADNAW